LLGKDLLHDHRRAEDMAPEPHPYGFYYPFLQQTFFPLAHQNGGRLFFIWNEERMILKWLLEAPARRTFPSQTEKILPSIPKIRCAVRS